MIPRPTGCMRAPPGRSGARTPSTRRWSWRRSSCSTCTLLGTGGMRWRARFTWPSGRWRSGSRTGGWKWRNRARTNPRTSGTLTSAHIQMNMQARSHLVSNMKSPFSYVLNTKWPSQDLQKYMHIHLLFPISLNLQARPREPQCNHTNLYNRSIALLTDAEDVATLTLSS